MCDAIAGTRLSETYQIQRTTLFQTGLRLENRLNTPESFEPAHRKAMLLVYRLLLQEVSGQESYLIDVYRKTLRQLGDSTRQTPSN